MTGRQIAAAAAFVLLALPARDGRGQDDLRQIGYQGVLERNGSPVTAPGVSFQVTLYDDRVAGNVVWGPEEIAADVAGGRFSIVIGANPLQPYLHQEGTPVYLDIQVRMPGEPAYVPLSGRQRFLATPVSVAAIRSDRDFYVGGSLTTAADLNTHQIQADGASVTGLVQADGLSAIGSVTAGSASVSGRVEAGSVTTLSELQVDQRGTDSRGKKFYVYVPSGGAVQHVYINDDPNGSEGLHILHTETPTHTLRVPLYVDAERWVPGTNFGGNHSPGNYSAYFKANIIAAGYHGNSDARLKNVLADHDPAGSLDNLLKLKVREFTFREEFAPHIGRVAGARYVGLLAQELEGVLPDAVTTAFPLVDGDRVLLADPHTIQTDRLVYESIGAIQALNRKLESEVGALREENRALKEEIRAIRAMLPKRD